jgi:hypothetical protein
MQLALYWAAEILRQIDAASIREALNRLARLGMQADQVTISGENRTRWSAPSAQYATPR